MDEFNCGNDDVGTGVIIDLYGICLRVIGSHKANFLEKF